MSSSRPFVEAMGEAGYRVTEPRRAVAELVASREGHFTAADLIDAARLDSLDIGRATIFRSLDLFTELEARDSGLAAAVEQIQVRTGWPVETHRFELYGLCPTCRHRRPS